MSKKLNEKRLASLLVAIGLCIVVGSSQAWALDGKQLFTRWMCQTCHGEEGKAPVAPLFPRLAGQNADYVVNQIKDIASGRRANALTSTMKGAVTNIPEAELRAIGQYLQSVAP